MKKPVIVAIFAAAFNVLSNQSSAHFPFLATNEQGDVVLFFGENLANRNYKITPAVEKAEVQRMQSDGSLSSLEMHSVESDDFKGMATQTSLKPGEAAFTQMRYGVYHGTLLDYYCVYLASVPTSKEPSRPLKLDLPLNAQVVSTEQGIEVSVTWQGRPLKSAKVSLSCSEGHTEAENKTDSDGKVRFTYDDVEAGLNALLIGHQVNESGEWKEQKYESCSHYLTVTFSKK